MGNKQNKTVKPDFKELSKNIGLSTSEVKAWFSKFSKDFPKGLITRENFEKLYSDMIGAEGDPKDFCNHVFRQYDINGNGVIDFREFVTTVAVATKGSINEKLAWTFSLYDLDGNHHLSREEITKVLRSIYKAKNKTASDEEIKEIIESIFATADENGDGVLSEKEFIQNASNNQHIKELIRHL